MIEVNYDLLDKRQHNKTYVNEKIQPNMFYVKQPCNPYISEYHGVYVDNYFGTYVYNENINRTNMINWI